MIEFMIDFNDMKKSERSEYINGIWGINQILKNTFLSFYLDSGGKIISDKLNKLESGYHSAESELNRYIPVPENNFLRIDSTKIYDVIKDYKSLIDGIFYKDDNAYFKVRDVGDIVFGRFTKSFSLPTKYPTNRINMMLTPDNITKYGKLHDDEIEVLIDKQILEKIVDKYHMIISHKLFPSLKKSSSVEIGIEEYNDAFFGGTFALCFDITNSSGKKCFSKLRTYHKYNFIFI